ncbi:MAG TPA: ParB/RepB/Spo0J family partition protein [Candidatus Saccharimonadales bacterium]|nr:ParB/RepB/Spo0J family partition protein [Candidatus Saccharimonadales bacterium]
MSAKQTGLGTGFDSLLPKNFDDALLLSKSDKIEKIPVSKLMPNKYQPRKEFEDSAIQDLAASIKQYGILQPIVVTQTQNGNFMIIAGERRWRAAKHAKLAQVPAIVRSTKELEQLELALIENVQRVDLSPLEQAVSIEYLHEQLGTTYEIVAQRLGKATSTVHNIVRLLQLPDEATIALREKQITEGHARAILSLKGLPDKQQQLLQNITAHGWSVRQAEQFAVSVKDGFRESKETHERMRTETPETKRLAKRFGTKVSIRRTAKGGKIEIAFKTDDQLNEIISQLG